MASKASTRRTSKTRTAPAGGRRTASTTHDPYAYICDHCQDGPTRRTTDMSAAGRFFWWCNKRRVELAPAGAAIALLATSATFYKAELPAVGLVAGSALVGVTWWVSTTGKWDRSEEIWFARISSLAATLWLIAACIVGPLNPVVFWALVIGLIGGGAALWHHKLVRPAQENALLDQWAFQWVEIRDVVALPGSRVIEVDGDDNYAEITIQLAKGQTAGGIGAGAAEVIAGCLGLPAKAIKIRDMRKVNASKIKVIYSKVSSIDALISWADVTPMLPTSVTKPFVLGRQETGDWKKVDARGHWMIVGQTRGGKSNEVHALMANITGAYNEADPESKADALVFFIDLKGGSVGARWIECVDWFARDMDEAVKVMESSVGMIKARGEHAPVGEGDGDQLVPTAERPAIFIVFDECAEGLGVSPGMSNPLKTKLTSLAETVSRMGAAMNIYLVLAGQDGSLETYGSERLRGNLTKRLGFRVAKSANAQYVIDRYTELDVTGLEDGQFYYHERADDPVPIRGPFMTPEDNPTLPQQISRRNAARRPTLDRETAQGGGQDYATRAERLPAKFRKAITTTPEAATVPVQREVPTMEHSPDSAHARALALEVEAGLHSGPPITAADMKQARTTGEFDLAEDLKDTTDTFCSLLANAPLSGIKVKPLYETVGVGRTWAHDRLTALKEAGLVEQPAYGFWRASNGVRARELREALDSWDAGRKQLVPA